MLCVVGYLLGRGRILCKILMLADDNLVGKKGSFIIFFFMQALIMCIIVT